MSNLVFHRDIFVEDEDFRLKRLPYYVTHEYFGGGKTSTSTQSVSIPPEVLARYNSVNATAEKTAQTPFQQYSSDPNAFVAPLNDTQQQGIANTNAGATAAQPYYGAATNMAMAGSGPTNVGQLSGQDIQQYMNPFINDVVNPTAQLLNQQQQAQMSGQTGNAIKSGAFGGDRAGIAAANLAGQQSLSFANAINPLYSQAYTSGLGAAQQQQGFNLGQQQANLGRLSQGAQTIAGLGTGAQTAALQGAQSQLAAGQVGQQTEQAGKSALYNQFLQQQGYPFQTAQFLANIAEGTGALSGSTTTTTQPRGLLGNRGGLMRADGGSVDIENEGQGYYAGGLSHGGYAEGGAPGLQIFGMPHQHSVNPGLAAALSAGVGGARQLMRPTMALPKLPASGLSEVSSLVSGGNDLASGLGKAADTAKSAWNKVSPSQAPAESAHGGLVGYAGGGDVDPYHPDDRDGYMGPTMKAQNAAPRPQLLQAGAAPPKPDSALKQLQGGVGAAKNIYGAGKELYGAGKGLASFIGSDAAAAGAEAADAAAAAAAEAPLELSGATLGGLGAGAAASGMPAWLMALGLPFGVQRGGSVRQGLAAGGRPEDGYDYAEPTTNPVGAAALNPTFADKIQDLQQDAGDAGIPTKLISGRRSNATQAALYDRYLNGGNLAAPPGHSLHEAGLAADVVANDPSQQGALIAMAKEPWRGIKAGADFGDRPHFQLAGERPTGIAQADTGTVNRLGYAPDSARTGQGGLGAISRASPDQVAQNDAAPDAGLGAGASRNLAPASTGLAGLFEKNKNWLIPLARGLGAAQQSHALGLAGTLAAGIGGAGKAYAEQEQEQAGLGQTEANTGLTRAQTAESMARIVSANLNHPTIVITADGRPMLKSAWILAYANNPNTAPKLLGGNEAAVATAAASAGSAGTAQRGPAPVPKVGEPLPSINDEASPAAPVSPSAPAAPAAPSQGAAATSTFAPALEEIAAEKKRLTALAVTGYDPATAPQPKAYSDQYDSAQRAQDQKQLAVPLVNALSNLPKTGLQSSGPQQQALAPVVSYLQGLARTLNVDASGLTPQLLTSQDTASQEEVNKLVSRMQSKAVSSAGLTAYSAFRDVARGIPGILNSPAGQAKLIPQILTDVQRDIDRNEYMTNHLKAVTQGNPLIQDVATRAGGAQAGKAFDDKFNNDFYQNERNALEKMYDAPVTDTKTGKTTSVMSLLSSGTPLPPDFKAAVEKKYGPNILRYFGTK